MIYGVVSGIVMMMVVMNMIVIVGSSGGDNSYSERMMVNVTIMKQLYFDLLLFLWFDTYGREIESVVTKRKKNIHAYN